MEIKWDNIESPIVIKLDPHDTYSLDIALAQIIAPMIKQLRATNHGAPNTDNEDVPENLRSDAFDEWSVGVTHFEKWNWILSEMEWAFQNYDLKHDAPTKEQWERIMNGIRLFAKYYPSLWD